MSTTNGEGAAPGEKAPGPPAHLGIRNLVSFASDQLHLLRRIADEHGDVARIRVLGRDFYLVSHPDDIESVMVKHAAIMLRDEYAVVLERALGKGLLTSDGELWKRQRKLMAQAFSPKRIATYAETMVRVADQGLRFGEGQEINVHGEMSRVTMEVVSEVLFGSGVGPREVQTVSASMEIINEFLANSPEALLKVPAWVPTPRNVRVRAAIARIDEIIFRIIAARRMAPPRDDLLGTLLAAQDDAGAGMTDEQLRDEAITLFLAGHETTALLLAHTLYLLSKHPAVERALHAEIADVLRGRLPSGDDVKDLPYTERVLKESMRLYPPAWTTGREAAEDVDVGGFRIPKGAQILLSQWVVHRDPRWFPNPEGFDPDRWESPKKLPRYAYFPFGGGPRICIGNHFAMMEATLLLAIVVQRYRVELLPGERLELRPAVTLRQSGPGLRARVALRDGSASARARPVATRPVAPEA